jgi:peptide/nickel transport system ATP-binding protein
MMLELDSLTIRYGTGRRSLTAVDRVSLRLPRGTVTGLVGESGSGKSTLALGLVGLVPVTGGSIRLGGEDYTAEKRRHTSAFRRRVQLVFQDPYSSLDPRMTVADILDEALSMRAGLDRRQRSVEAGRLLELIGLSARALPRFPYEFSGGQRQRIAIARALAVEPEALVLDEITSALDVSVQATILNLLVQLQRELSLTLLFISHNLSIVSLISDVVAVMYLGQIVEYGTGAGLFADARHPYTQALIDSVPYVERDRKPAPLLGDPPDPRRPPAGCRFHTRCPVGPVFRPDRTVCTNQDPRGLLAPGKPACHFAPARA